MCMCMCMCMRMRMCVHAHVAITLRMPLHLGCRLQVVRAEVGACGVTCEETAAFARAAIHLSVTTLYLGMPSHLGMPLHLGSRSLCWGSDTPAQGCAMACHGVDRMCADVLWCAMVCYDVPQGAMVCYDVPWCAMMCYDVL